MEQRTFVFIVCSPLPRVGKTLVTRLVAEFFSADERPVAAFDLNPDDYALAEQLSDRAAPASVADTRGQVALFDRLVVADGVTKAVDVGYRCYDQFFAVMSEIGFAAGARERAVLPVILFVAEADRRAMQSYAALRMRFAGVPVVPVFNAGTVDARSRSDLGMLFPGVPIQIPFLTPEAKSMVAQFGLSPGISGGRSADTANALQAWKRRVFLQFRELELRLMLDELKPALQLRA